MRLLRSVCSRSVAALLVLAPLSARASIASHEASDDPETQSSHSGGLKPIEVHLGVGAGGLSMKGASAAFAYDDGQQQLPLQLKMKSERIRPAASLSVYLNVSGLSFPRLQLSPYISGDLLIGSLVGARGSAGLRAMYGKGRLRPWAAIGAGYAQLNGPIATVPGGTALTAPDQTQVTSGTEISAFASSFGVDFRLGANYAINDTWGVSALLGYSLFTTITDWEARTTNSAGQDTTLSRLQGLPAASLTGPNAFVGVTYSYSQ
jgi:hypothetical protein